MNERYIKGSALVCITYLEKEDDKMRVTDTTRFKCTAKDFERLIYDKPNLKIEVVNQKPENFQLGVLYVLADGKRVWTWQLNG